MSEQVPARASSAVKLVWSLSLLLLVLALASLGRAWVARTFAVQQPAVRLTVPVSYVVWAALAWGIVLGACALALWCLWPWGRPATLIALTLFQVHRWVDFLLFEPSDYSAATWSGRAVLSVVLLALVWGVLNLRPVRRLFQRSMDHEPPRRQERQEREAI